MSRLAVLALVLLASASTLPWAQVGAGTKQATHHILVFDASLSMNQLVDGKPAFAQARRLAVQKLKSLPAGDACTVLVVKDNPSWLIGVPSRTLDLAAREIDALKPTHGNAALGSALSLVASKLSEQQPHYHRQAVYFFTDMQRATWLDAVPDLKNEAEAKEKQAYLEIQKLATTIIVDVGNDNAGNVAVTDMGFKNLYVTANTDVLLTASVYNFSTETKKDLRVELLTGKAKENANDVPLQMRVVSQKNCTLAPGERQTIEFDDFKFATSGTYAVQVKIVAADALNEDNTRTVVITVRDTIPILIVNGKSSADRFERASEYLKLSLNPFPAGAEPKWAPLRPKVVTPAQFSNMTGAELEYYDCIFWCDVGQFDGNDVRKIDAHLRRGGGFVVSMGDRAADNLDNYNRLLFNNEQGILPVEFHKYKDENKVAAPAEHHFYLQNTDAHAFTLPPLQAFTDDADRLTLRTARFRQFVKAAVPEGKARVVLSFMPEVANIAKVKRAELPVNSPAIVEWNPPLPKAYQTPGSARYRGKVVLFTSSVNMDWTNWPGSPSFPAMLQELTRMGVAGRLREQSLTVGSRLEAFLAAGAEADVVVKRAGAAPAKVRTQAIEDDHLFRYADTDHAGVYVATTDGRPELPFAVNVPAATADQRGTESDLGRIDEARLRDLFPGWKFTLVRDPLQAKITDGPVNKKAVLLQQGVSNLAILIDDSGSMSVADVYADDAARERMKKLGETIRTKLVEEIPAAIQALKNELDRAERNPDAKEAVAILRQRLQYWITQHDQLAADKWRPNRLQLTQALLTQPGPDGLAEMMAKKRAKIQIFHLDAEGRAVKLTDNAGDAGNIREPEQVERAVKAIAKLEPIGNESRLGTALRQVIDHYRGSRLEGVVMFTDGVTTRDETIAQAAEYAARQGVPLYFVGLGNEQPARDLKLHDLRVEDDIHLGDFAIFEVQLTGQGFKALTVPVILKVRDAKDKDAKEKEVAREIVKVDPTGKSIRLRLRHKPNEVGRKTYIIEAEPPGIDKGDKPITPANLRIERTIEVLDVKTTRVLYVEGQPRYEFRAIKNLLEREAGDPKRMKRFELKVLLLDADDDIAAQDKTALKHFPPTLDELNRYDVLILGDCDPKHKKLKNHLKDIVRFVLGEDEKGNKAAKSGGGILFLAGVSHNPHHYKGTPLAAVMPIEPIGDAAVDKPRTDPMRPMLTAVGRAHPIFRFSADAKENALIWNRQTPMYWSSSNYRAKLLAEVLAVHRERNKEHHPLVVEQLLGSGRSMFFGFDETWRWRFRDHEPFFNTFWTQTLRHLAQAPSTRTVLRLDRQTPYRVGDKIGVTVRFPALADLKTEVKVLVTHQPRDAKAAEPETWVLQLTKIEGSWGTYEGLWLRAREGRYRFWLANPDVSKLQPDGEKPFAEAVVEAPPGELARLQMNGAEMRQAAETTNGAFATWSNAERVLDALRLKKQ